MMSICHNLDNFKDDAKMNHSSFHKRVPQNVLILLLLSLIFGLIEIWQGLTQWGSLTDQDTSTALDPERRTTTTTSSSSPVNFRFVEVYKDNEAQSHVHIPVIERSALEHETYQRNKEKWCFQPIAADLESPKLVIAETDFAEETPEDTFDYVRQKYENLQVRMTQDFTLLPNITTADKLFPMTQRVESPVIHNAAVCQLPYKVKDLLQHFPHAMQEVYKCFGYWIDSRCGEKHGKGKNGITPVLLFDKASQEMPLMGKAFATNPFMMGIREFLETELGLVLMSTDEYYGMNGYYFRHSVEWNQHMDVYLRKKKLGKGELATTSGTEEGDGEDSEATEASLAEKEGMPKEAETDGRNELPKTGNTLAPSSRTEENEDKGQDSDATESIGAGHASEGEEANSGEVENEGSGEAFHEEKDSNGFAETNGEENRFGDANQEKVAVSGIRRKGDIPLQFHTCVKPPRIGILNRRKSRTILNSDELAKELSKLVYVYERNASTTPLKVRSDVPVSVAYFEGKDFLEQVEFFRHSDILISGHGAQLTGLPFMANDVSESRAKSCKYVMELFPKKYGLPCYFGTLAVQSLIGHSYVYYDDGLPHFEAGKPPVQNRKVKRQPLQELKPWDQINSQTYRERAQARGALFCPRPEDMVEYVSRLIHEWYKCHGCGM